MSNPGAKPNPSPTVRAIVRYGLNREQRAALARRDPRIVRQLHDCGYHLDTIVHAIAYAQDLTRSTHV